MISKEHLKTQLKQAGVVKGDLIHLKVSMRAIGKINGGANTLIEALLDAVGDTGTIVSDAFLLVYKKGRAREKYEEDSSPASYAGAFVNAMSEYPGAKRSSHPVQKFVAIGHQADYLTKNHTPQSNAYELLKEMARLNGKNLKVGAIKKVPGVGTTHVAISDCNFTQYRLPEGVYYADEQGEAVFFERNWTGGCARGFNKLIPLYDQNDGILYQGKLGDADLLITDMAKTLEVEFEHISKNPTSFLCDHEDCIDCRLSWSFSDRSLISFIITNIKSLKFKMALRAIHHSIFSKKLIGG